MLGFVVVVVERKKMKILNQSILCLIVFSQQVLRDKVIVQLGRSGWGITFLYILSWESDFDSPLAGVGEPAGY